MEITIIATALLLWLVLGGIVAILICPLLKEPDADESQSPSLDLGKPPLHTHHPNPIANEHDYL
jgi:hypothetical protein